MVTNFFDLFCAGEEQTNSYVGSKVMDAGDIKQSLKGISTIGRGEIALAASKPWKRDHYRDASKGSVALAGAIEQAINNLCLKVNMEDARTILALVCAPKDVITLNALADISNALQERSPKSVIRIGDYPRRGKEVSLTIILSTLTSSHRMEDLFTRAEHFLEKEQEINKEAELKIMQMHEKSAKIPSLD
jgi:cell division GTPase FtsZ